LQRPRASERQHTGVLIASHDAGHSTLKERDMSVETIERPATETSAAQQESGRRSARRLQQGIEPVRAQLSSAYTVAQEKTKQAMEGAEAYVHRSPLRAVAYAAGIAAVLGALGVTLLGRRNGKDRTDDEIE
jgi:ElaB/YqjD/DUF883 family membrane-anchored ribosome-binding protein